MVMAVNGIYLGLLSEEANKLLALAALFLLSQGVRPDVQIPGLHTHAIPTMALPKSSK